MSTAARRSIGALILIFTVGLTSCVGLMNVLERGETPAPTALPGN